MPQTLFILGRTPTLSLAELLAVFPHATVTVATREFTILDGVNPRDVDLTRIGGVVKVGEILADSDRLHFDGAAELLRERYVGGARLTFGASLHGGRPGMLKTLLIGIKKALKTHDITSRFINHNFQNLTSAQSGLAKLPEAGMELLVATDGKNWWYAATTAVQPFDAYRRRDYEKAVRDARVGMLPPKLAQMLVNLALGHSPSKDVAIYDPFCGTGTVLVEAALLGHAIVGSDRDLRMVEAARENVTAFKFTGTIFSRDATRPLISPTLPLHAIATEGYLGPVFSRLPPPPVRARIFAELAELYAAFFTHTTAQTVVLTLPAYVENSVPRYFSSAIIEPAIIAAGWQKIDLLARAPEETRRTATSHVALTYFRPDQIVAREVVAWTRALS